MAISFDSALGVHPQALLVRTQRAEVLANNIANADTPNYQARDLDFKALLAEQQQASRSGALPLAASNRNHQNGIVDPSLAPELLYRNPTQPSIDGNTVDMQREQSEYASNAMAFQASFIFLNRKFSGLLTAIKGE